MTSAQRISINTINSLIREQEAEIKKRQEEIELLKLASLIVKERGLPQGGGYEAVIEAVREFWPRFDVPSTYYLASKKLGISSAQQMLREQGEEVQ